MLKVLGKGAFSTVYLVEHNLITQGVPGSDCADKKMQFAMKVIPKNGDNVKDLSLEHWVLSKMEHPFIITLHYSFETDDHFFLFLDYINGGDLFQKLKKKSYLSET